MDSKKTLSIQSSPRYINEEFFNYKGFTDKQTTNIQLPRSSHPEVNICGRQPNVHGTFVCGSAISEHSYNVHDVRLMFAYKQTFINMFQTFFKCLHNDNLCSKHSYTGSAKFMGTEFHFRIEYI